MKPTTSPEAITFTHILGPNNISTVSTENLDRFTEKQFWYRIQQMLDNSLPSLESSAARHNLIFIRKLACLSFVTLILFYKTFA